MTAQTEGILAQAGLLLKEKFIRIDEQTHQNYKLGDISSIDDLVQLSKETARHLEKMIIEKFFEKEREDFTPIYSL